jgi:rhomboid protease GluP
VIRKFLNDTLDMILDGLAAVGLLRGGAAWTRQRWQQRRQQLGADAENIRRASRSSHRMCRECRELVPISENVCSACGASMRQVASARANLISRLLPGFGSVSTLLLSAMVVMYGISTLGERGSLFHPDPWMLVRLGWKDYSLIWDEGQWWRVINPVFLHGSIAHLFMNGYSLSSLGPWAESEIGSRRFLFVFVTTGIASFVVSAWFSNYPSVGASGALFGLIGFGIVYGYCSKSPRLRAQSSYLLQWALLGVLMLLIGRIDHWAHAGGFFSGCLLGGFVHGRQPRTVWGDRIWTVLAAIAAILPVIGLVLATLAPELPPEYFNR